MADLWVVNNVYVGLTHDQGKGEYWLDPGFTDLEAAKDWYRDQYDIPVSGWSEVYPDACWDYQGNGKRHSIQTLVVLGGAAEEGDDTIW